MVTPELGGDVVTRSIDATQNVARETTECWCGAGTIPARPRCPTCGRVCPGPRRISHDLACRRRRDRLVRQWLRRQEWLAAWRAARRFPHDFDVSPERVDAEIAQLRGELEALERELGRGLDGVTA